MLFRSAKFGFHHHPDFFEEGGGQMFHCPPIIPRGQSEQVTVQPLRTRRPPPCGDNMPTLHQAAYCIPPLVVTEKGCVPAATAVPAVNAPVVGLMVYTEILLENKFAA